jgi:hypothetical protein
MRLEDAPATPAADGLGGTLRLLAVLLIGGLAALGVLVVFDVLPRDLFENYAGKFAWTAGIVAVAGAAIVLVMKAGRSR